jgi:nucleoside-diphosphate-sugar epimerase
MRLFVTGGTGAIGRHAVPALVEAGHSVAALARTPAKAEQLRHHGATPVEVSLFDRTALTEAFRNKDAVVNLTSALPSMMKFIQSKPWRENDRVRIEGSAAVVDAALAAEVPRVLQESVSMLYPDRGSQWIDEDVAPDVFRISRANLAAEANAKRFSGQGGTGVVLRFGFFYGPGARHSEQFLEMARRHITPVIGPPDSYVSSIHMRDAGEAVVAALDVPGGTYNVVDNEPLTKRDYAAAMAAAVGKKAWLRGPGRLALLLGERLTSLTRSLRVSNGRFRAITNWEPRYPDARSGWIATAKALNATLR